jgi:hypothetical protein
MSKSSAAVILPASAIGHRIYFLRNTRVMLDSDLAQLYGVTTSNLNQAVSSVLHSDRAVEVNIAIMRAFLERRAMLATHEGLRRKVMEMEKRYDSQFHAVFATLRQMLETPIPPKRQIGFHSRANAS